jgi:hypothetical protein
MAGLFSWEIARNPLIFIWGFCTQLGKNLNKIKAGYWTLNQRVAGSSPAAPTIRSIT